MGTIELDRHVTCHDTTELHHSLPASRQLLLNLQSLLINQPSPPPTPPWGERSSPDNGRRERSEDLNIVTRLYAVGLHVM